MAPTVLLARDDGPGGPGGSPEKRNPFPPPPALPQHQLRTPTALLADDASAVLASRAPAQTSLIPQVYAATTSGPTAGVVVGITLGSVGGFLLFIALLYTCLNFGRGSSPAGGLFMASASVLDTSSFGGASSYVSRRTQRQAHRDRRRRRHSRRETVEVRGSRARPVVVDPPLPQRVVVEEERIRRTSGVRPAQSTAETVDSDDDEIVVEEEDDGRRRRARVESDDDDGDDDIVVIEENSSGRPRGGSRRARSSRTGSSRG